MPCPYVYGTFSCYLFMLTLICLMCALAGLQSMQPALWALRMCPVL